MAGRKYFVSLKLESQSGDLRLSKQAALTTAPGPPPFIPSSDTFVTNMSFLELYNPVKEHLYFIDGITLENRSFVGLHEGRRD